jgi:hypothetical protein
VTRAIRSSATGKHLPGIGRTSNLWLLGCWKKKGSSWGYWYVRVANRLGKQSELGSDTTLTQHRKGNAHNCGLGVSPSQETAHLKHMEEKGLSYCMHTIT